MNDKEIEIDELSKWKEELKKEKGKLEQEIIDLREVVKRKRVRCNVCDGPTFEDAEVIEMQKEFVKEMQKELDKAEDLLGEKVNRKDLITGMIIEIERKERRLS